MKVVILCGGAGTRLREEMGSRPKPLAEIGHRPILWHVMKIYSQFGFHDFVLCLGHNGHMIKEYFLNYVTRHTDFTISLSKPSEIQLHGEHDERNWRVTLADTGQATMTGGRVKRIQHLIDTDTFMVTYGDGVADIDIPKLLEFHASRKATATVTGVRPNSQFGIFNVTEEGRATGFTEKPRMTDWVNGGFFVLERRAFDYLTPDCVLEQEPLRRLSAEGQLAIYPHDGFWQCMDTFKDVEYLNRLWFEKQARWATWENRADEPSRR